jgi:proteasome accessory factor A
MSQTATFLKVASTCVVLAMIEDGVFPQEIQLLDPVKAVQTVSSDPSLRSTVEFRNGKAKTALDIQRQICALALDYLSQNIACIGAESAQLLARLWPQILDSLEDRNDFALRTVDWIAKERIVLAYADRHGITGEDPKLKLLDLQYHDMRPDKCLAGRANLDRLVDETLVDLAINEPPEDTRAYFRGKCVSKWPRDVVSANWDSMVVDVGGGELRRIAMSEPQRGTRDLIGSLVDKAVTTNDLVRLLGDD